MNPRVPVGRAFACMVVAALGLSLVVAPPAQSSREPVEVVDDSWVMPGAVPDLCVESGVSPSASRKQRHWRVTSNRVTSNRVTSNRVTSNRVIGKGSRSPRLLRS